MYYNYVYIYLIIYVYMEAFQLSVEETAKTGNSTWQVYMEDGLLELVQAPEMMGMWKNMGCWWKNHFGETMITLVWVDMCSDIVLDVWWYWP